VLSAEQHTASLAVKSSLPILRTSGTDIIRADTGERVILKGVSSDFFRYRSLDRPVPALLADMDEAKKWGANLFGLYVLPSLTREKISSLDEVIAHAKEIRMYVYLMPIVNDESVRNYSDTGPSLQKFLSDIALRFRNDSHILYGLGAEPFGMTATAWNNRQKTLAAFIRVQNPDAPLLLTGADYGRNFTYAYDEDFPYSNAIYFVTDYPRSSPETDADSANNYSFDYDQFLNRRPFIMGEFGGVWKKGFGSDTDIDTIRQQIMRANANGFGYTMYRNEPLPDYLTELSIHRTDGSLTKKGHVLVSDLAEHPPTSF
jgi:hypothetical protein